MRLIQRVVSSLTDEVGDGGQVRKKGVTLSPRISQPHEAME
jgi:hypothetical protein